MSCEEKQRKTEKNTLEKAGVLFSPTISAPLKTAVSAEELSEECFIKLQELNEQAKSLGFCLEISEDDSK
jgi:hypothetical protein